MREIKYRAWDTKKNTWCNIVVIDLNGNLYFSTSSQGNGEVVLVGPLNKDIIILQQYTGLKDKNGKDIYEGDIVSVPERYIGDHLCKAFIGEVVFEEGGFRVDSLIEGKDWMDDCIALYEAVFSYNSEVTGNIYENPELLENRK